MTFEQLVAFYGNANKAARALGYHRQRVSRWKQGIPRDAQIDIEVASEGKLKADLPKQVRKPISPQRKRAEVCAT